MYGTDVAVGPIGAVDPTSSLAERSIGAFRDDSTSASSNSVYISTTYFVVIATLTSALFAFS